MKGHIVTVARGGHQVNRHVSFFKRFEGNVDKKTLEDNVSEEDDEGTCYTLEEEEETPQRRYPIRNRRQTSFYEAVRGVSKTKSQTFN